MRHWPSFTHCQGKWLFNLWFPLRWKPSAVISTWLQWNSWSDHNTIKAANQMRASAVWRPANTDQHLAFSSYPFSPSPSQNHQIPLKLGSDVLFLDLVILVKVLAVYTQSFHSKSRSKIVGTNHVQTLGDCRLVLIDGWEIGQVPALAVLAALITTITKCTKSTCFKELNSVTSQ